MIFVLMSISVSLSSQSLNETVMVMLAVCFSSFSEFTTAGISFRNCVSRSAISLRLKSTMSDCIIWECSFRVL